MRVVIRCDGAKIAEIGTGHIIRMLGIARILVADKFCQKEDILFVTRTTGHFAIGANAVAKSGFKILQEICEGNLEWNSLSEAETLKKLNPDLLIIDRLNCNYDWMAKIKQSKTKVVVFDDVGSGGILADALINGIFNIPKPPLNCFQGYDYLSLNTLPLLGKFRFNDHVSKIVATFGGHDERNLTAFFLKSLIELSRSIKNKDYIDIEILVGYESTDRFSEWKKKIDLMNSLGWKKVVIFERPIDFYERVTSADILVCAGGLTVFEGLSLGVPTIGIAQYKHQMKTLLKLSSVDALILGSKSMKLNSKYFQDCLNSLIKSKSKRKILSNRGVSTVDGFGNQRILRVIKDLTGNMI